MHLISLLYIPGFLILSCSFRSHVQLESSLTSMSWGMFRVHFPNGSHLHQQQIFVSRLHLWRSVNHFICNYQNVKSSDGVCWSHTPLFPFLPDATARRSGASVSALSAFPAGGWARRCSALPHAAVSPLGNSPASARTKDIKAVSAHTQEQNKQ